MTPKIAECIIKSAPLHDFGKIAIPDVILNKPGKFEPEEYEIMKQHSAKGATIVASIIEESCGTHFDPYLCREFLECRPRLEKLYDSYED